MIVTPGRSLELAERDGAVDLEAGDAVLDHVGDVVRHGLDRDLTDRVLEDAAGLDVGLVDVDQLDDHLGLDRHVEVDAQQVDVHGLPADGVTDALLEHDGFGGAVVDLEIDHAPARASALRRRDASIWKETGSLPPP